ncbi:capping complex subunit for YIEGIA [Caloranaerobacter sp. DY30410]|uniref:capping complex subunit for YIEGIA n=1 Tax=Caloranaerobacter sp. DY30410 TaxID=3238305 RepID=UPI003D075B98
MDIGFKETILAVVTTRKDIVCGDNVPVFYVKDEEEREKIALLLSKITLGMVHDLENGAYVIVRH